MDPIREHIERMSRRYFFGRTGTGIGVAALASLLDPSRVFGSTGGRVGPGTSAAADGDRGVLVDPHFPARAKRVIYLSMNGAPSQLETFDYKPKLSDMFDADLPDSVRMGQRITTMTSGQSRLPIAPSVFKFNRHGQSGAWVSELLPHTASVVDDLCIVRSMFTEAINHDPAITFFQTGSEIAGRPSMGSWISYGLGSMNENLPAFVVLVTPNKGDQPLYSRLWGNGFLDSRYQGVRFAAGRDPVYYLTNPEGVSAASRRMALDTLGALNRIQSEREP